MNQPFSLSVRCTVSDLVRMALFIRNQNFVYRYDAILVGLIIFLVMVAVVLLMANDLREIRIPALVIVGVIPAVIVGAAVYLLHRFFRPWRIRLRLEKYFESYPVMTDALDIEISDEGIRSTGKLSSSFISWAAFVKVIESKTDLIFYTTGSPGLLLPKASFASEEQFLSVRAFVAETIGPKADLI